MSVETPRIVRGRNDDDDRDADRRRDLVRANRILAQEGVVDGWGHVSVRSAAHPDRFLLARPLAPRTVGADDVTELHVIDGEPLDGGRSYLERHIHAGVYRAHPHAQAVVHHHSPDLIPFGVTPTSLYPISHVAAFLAAGAPVFEIRDAVGPASNLLIDTPRLGDELAAVFGDAAVVLMRGHGASILGSSLPQAVYRAVYAAREARVLQQAWALNSVVTYLSPEEARLAAETIDQGLSRVWQGWVGHLDPHIDTDVDTGIDTGIDTDLRAPDGGAATGKDIAP